MMRFNLILATALAATLSAGCSTTGTREMDDDEKVYVTGSRIPKNDRAAAGVTSTTDKGQINDMMRRPGGAAGGVVGAGGS